MGFAEGLVERGAQGGRQFRGQLKLDIVVAGQRAMCLFSTRASGGMPFGDVAIGAMKNFRVPGLVRRPPGRTRAEFVPRISLRFTGFTCFALLAGAWFVVAAFLRPSPGTINQATANGYTPPAKSARQTRTPQGSWLLSRLLGRGGPGPGLARLCALMGGGRCKFCATARSIQSGPPRVGAWGAY
jgi:hypothetical protein